MTAVDATRTGTPASEVTGEVAEWLVWSVTHDMWWKANSAGYTSDLWTAGRYTATAAAEAAARAGRNAGRLPHNVAVLAPEAGTDGRLSLEEIRMAPRLMTRRIADAIGVGRAPATEAEKASGRAERPARGDIVRVPPGVDSTCLTTYAISVDTNSDYGVGGPRVKKNGELMAGRVSGLHVRRVIPWDLIPKCEVVRSDRAYPGVGRSG